MFSLHKILPLCFLFCCFMLPCQVQAALTESTVLSVDGYGEATASPDQAIITVSVRNHSVNSELARNENATRSAAVQTAILNIGIPEENIQTGSYFFHPTYSSARDKEHSITGFEVNNSIVVTLNDLNLIGRVIDVSLANGANTISSLDFDILNKEQLRKTALLAAIRDAKEKAGIIAKGLGKTIAGIKTVSESTGNIGHAMFHKQMVTNSDAISVGTPIEIGTLSLTASVHIEFLLN